MAAEPVVVGKLPGETAHVSHHERERERDAAHTKEGAGNQDRQRWRFMTSQI